MLITQLQRVICDLQLIKKEYEIPCFIEFTAWLLYSTFISCELINNDLFSQHTLC